MIGLVGLIADHFTRRRAEDETRVLTALANGPRMAYNVCEATGLSSYRTYMALERLHAQGAVARDVPHSFLATYGKTSGQSVNAHKWRRL